MDSWGKIGRALSWVSTVAAFCPLPQCQAVSLATGLLSAGAFALGGDRRAARDQLIGTGLNLITGGRGQWVKSTSRLKVLSSSKNGLIGRAVTYQMKSSGRREFARGTYGRRVWAANSAWNVLPYTVTCGPKKCLA